MEGKSNDKSEEAKTATGLHIAKIIYAIEKVASTAMAIYSSVEPVIKAMLTKWEEDQMTRSRWYSPQLSRELVSRLYVKAKACAGTADSRRLVTEK